MFYRVVLPHNRIQIVFLPTVEKEDFALLVSPSGQHISDFEPRRPILLQCRFENFYFSVRPPRGIFFRLNEGGESP